MKNRIRSYVRPLGLVAALLLLLLAAGVALAAGNIDTDNKWAWGSNVGWLNFNDTNGGVTVYADHLEGDVWAENVGWIRLGSYDGGGAHTYANDAANTYGVNYNNTTGVLSGYAWGTNVGWINFKPTHGGVTINTSSGDFSGYAWGENVGWINFNSSGSGRTSSSGAYKVKTTSPTAVTIADFGGQAAWGRGPVLHWQTGDEMALSGFHIWRGSPAQAETRLTDQLIGASGGLNGNDYTWQDAAPLAWGQRLHYWLEAVEADGSSSFTGPVEVVGIGKLFLPSVGR